MLRGLLFALVLAACAGAPAFAVPPIQVWFGPHPQGSPDGLDRHFISFVESANETLDCCFYELRLDSIVEAFVTAKSRGVKIRFLVDDSNYYGKDAEGK